MRARHVRTATGAVAAVLCALCGTATASVVWNETANGDLSNNQAAPSAVTLALGTNSVIGSAGTGDTQDWIAVTVPAGFVLSTDVLAAYQSNDVQGFTGFQAGASFVGNPLTAGPYAGYAHFGTNATNGPFPPTNLVGADLLSLMANPQVAAGASGFTVPLPAGTYTFLIQQLGAATQYQFDFGVTTVPSPASASLLILGTVGAIGRRRR